MVFKGKIVQDQTVLVDTVRIIILIDGDGSWFGEFLAPVGDTSLLFEGQKYEIEFKDGRRLGIKVRSVASTGRIAFQGMGRLRKPSTQNC